VGAAVVVVVVVVEVAWVVLGAAVEIGAEISPCAAESDPLDEHAAKRRPTLKSATRGVTACRR
jgi:hypothetical protein